MLIHKLIETVTADPIGDIYRKCLYTDGSTPTWNDDKLRYNLPLLLSVYNSIIQKIIPGNDFLKRNNESSPYLITALINNTNRIIVQIFANSPGTKLRIVGRQGNVPSSSGWSVPVVIDVAWTNINITEEFTKLLKTLLSDTLEESVNDDPLGTIASKFVYEDKMNPDRIKYYSPAFFTAMSKIIEKNVHYTVEPISWEGNAVQILIGEHISITLELLHGTYGLEIMVELGEEDITDYEYDPDYSDINWTTIYDKQWLIGDPKANLTNLFIKALAAAFPGSIRNISEAVVDDPLGAVYKKCIDPRLNYWSGKQTYFGDLLRKLAVEAAKKHGFEIDVPARATFMVRYKEKYRIHFDLYDDRGIHNPPSTRWLRVSLAYFSEGRVKYDVTEVVNDDISEKFLRYVSRHISWTRPITEAASDDPIGTILKKTFVDGINWMDLSKLSYYRETLERTIKTIVNKAANNIDYFRHLRVGAATNYMSIMLKSGLKIAITIAYYSHQNKLFAYLSLSEGTAMRKRSEPIALGEGNITQEIENLVRLSLPKRKWNESVDPLEEIMLVEDAKTDPLGSILKQCFDSGKLNREKFRYLQPSLEYIIEKLCKNYDVNCFGVKLIEYMTIIEVKLWPDYRLLINIHSDNGHMLITTSLRIQNKNFGSTTDALSNGDVTGSVKALLHTAKRHHSGLLR